MNIRRRGVRMALLLLPLAASGAAAAPRPPRYHRVATVRLGGEGRWDYVAFDTVGRRVFVAHGGQVDVIDADAHKPLGAIPNTAGAHGIAFAQEEGRGYITNGRDSSVTVFDLKTLAPVARIPTGGANPDAIVYDPASRRVFAFNADAGTATAIDATTDSVVGRVELGGAPEFGVADGAGTIFVNLEDSSKVVAFDSRALTVTHAWPLAPCEEPTGMAMDRARRRLFIGCHNKLMAVMNADDGHVVQTLPIGDRVDANAFDSTARLAFSSNGDGTLTVVQEDDGDRFHVVSQVKTERGARTMALDPRTHRVYLATADYAPDPKPAADDPHPRPKTMPNTFRIIVYAP